MSVQPVIQTMNPLDNQQLLQSLLAQEMETDSSQESFSYGCYIQDRYAGGVYGQFEQDCCFIEQLMVKPEYRGLGVGSHLLHQVERACIQQKIKTLYLSILNPKDLPFFLGQGFAIRASLENVPASGFTRYILIKRL